MIISDLAPPTIHDLRPTLAMLPRRELSWIAAKHVQYLDDRIHKIGILTEYLAGCSYVEKERKEFVEFVDRTTRDASSDLNAYMTEYARRFRSVRTRVEQQCDNILTGATGSSFSERMGFWEDFAYINEVDSLHGMFLTSGRWYVNVMLPVFRELALCTLPATVREQDHATMAYDLARRVITPRFASPSPIYDPALERRFAAMLVPLLQHYDRKLLFLFEVLAAAPATADESLRDFVDLVSDAPEQFDELLSMGVYPPFAWHELHSSRRARRAGVSYDTATAKLREAAVPDYEARLDRALKYLAVFKEYELNYNNYNYKGRFGLASKHFYLQTSERMDSSFRERFLDAILGDRFFDALAVVKESEHT